MGIGVKAILGVLTVTLIAFIWMGRLDVKPLTPAGIAVTDRWTGNVYQCFGGCRLMYPRD